MNRHLYTSFNKTINSILLLLSGQQYFSFLLERQNTLLQWVIFKTQVRCPPIYTCLYHHKPDTFLHISCTHPMTNHESSQTQIIREIIHILSIASLWEMFMILLDLNRPSDRLRFRLILRDIDLQKGFILSKQILPTINRAQINGVFCVVCW